MMLPEQRRSPVLGVPAHTAEQADITDIEEAGPLLNERASSPSHYANAFEKPRGFFQETLQAARKLVGLIRGRRNFQVLLCSFFLTALASSDTKLLVQYISKRYEWTFAQVCFLTRYLINSHSLFL
jgi:hypothetical protein